MLKGGLVSWMVGGGGDGRWYALGCSVVVVVVADIVGGLS